METFQQRLKDLRLSKNMSQKQLAEMLGTTNSSVCDWERGRTEPDKTFVLKLADCLNVSTDYLLGRSDDLGIPIVSSPFLSDEEQSFLDLFRRLSRGERAQLLAFAAGLVGKERPDVNSEK